MASQRIASGQAPGDGTLGHQARLLRVWRGDRAGGALADGLGPRNATQYRAEVCPAGVRVADNAIIRMKERSAGQCRDPIGRVPRSRHHPRPAGDEQ